MRFVVTNNVPTDWELSIVFNGREACIYVKGLLSTPYVKRYAEINRVTRPSNGVFLYI